MRPSRPQSNIASTKKRTAAKVHGLAWGGTLVGKILRPVQERERAVRESEYWIARCEVTRGQFEAFMQDADYKFEKPTDWDGVDKDVSPTSDHPAQQVSWYHAVMYCNWLSRRECETAAYRKTGKKEKGDYGDEEYDQWELVLDATGYRLPLEVEWKYAAERVGCHEAVEFESCQDQRRARGPRLILHVALRPSASRIDTWRTIMNLLRTCVTITLLVPSFLCGQDHQEEGFAPLFNGQDFSGWVRTNTPESTWSYQDGMIVCTGKPIGEIRTEKMYQNFILEVEWRHLVPGGNAGIFLFADDITARGVPFHRAIEVQVLENAYGNTRDYTTHGDIFPIHGAKMVPVNGRGGDRAFPTENRSNPSPEWNHYRITAMDGDVSLAVNGKVVTQGKQCSPRKGYICLESEGGVVHYRNVQLKELPDTPVPAEEIAIANRGYESIYTGLDLSGWRAPAPSRNAWHVRDWVLAYEGQPDDHQPLVHEQTLENFGFVVDFKLNKPDSTFALELTNAEGSTDQASVLVYSTANQEELVRVGQWNRLEGTVIGSELKLTLNDRPLAQHPLKNLFPKRHLTLTPTGSIDHANLYLRQIE